MECLGSEKSTLGRTIIQSSTKGVRGCLCSWQIWGNLKGKLGNMGDDGREIGRLGVRTTYAGGVVVLVEAQLPLPRSACVAWAWHRLRAPLATH